MWIRLLVISSLCVVAGCGSTKKAGADADGVSDSRAEGALTDAASLGDAFNSGRDGPIQPQSGEDASTYVQTDAFAGWVGGACTQNADCVGSPAAVAVSAAKCLDEVYCLSGVCHGECTQSCVVVRSDVNPCQAPRLCVKIPAGGGLSLCKIKPVSCATAGDCPLVRLVLPDAGQAEWSCEDGICRYPAFEYATE